MTVYKIFSVHEEEFTKRLAKVNRKALRLGFPKVSAKVEHQRDTEGRLLSIIELDGELPRLEGWTFIAAVDFIGGETLVRTYKTGTIPPNFELSPTRCDHCGIRHQRVHAFVIEKAGEYRQIGSACLNDFLGQTDNRLVSGLLEAEEKLQEVEDSDFHRPTRDIDLTVYLGYVQLAIHAYGWMSRTKAADLFVSATADVAHHLMCDESAAKEAILKASNNDHKKYSRIADAIAWAKSQSGNDYLDNIAAIARLEIVPRQYDGYAASILASYERYLADEAARKVQAQDATPAPTGRQVVTGTILSIKEKWSEWGRQLKMTLKTTGGWKLYCTLPASIDTAERGDVVRLTVTVKPSRDDKLFAFGSRPSKAEIVGAYPCL